MNKKLKDSQNKALITRNYTTLYFQFFTLNFPTHTSNFYIRFNFHDFCITYLDKINSDFAKVIINYNPCNTSADCTKF